MLKLAVQSFIWRFLGEIVFFLVQLITMMILSRILTPKDFGISVSVTIVYSFFALFSDAGVKNIVIQRSDSNSEDLAKIYGFSLTMGAVITAIMFVLSPAAVLVFADSDIVYAVMATSVAMMFMSSTRVTSGALEKRFKYGKTMLASIVAAIASGVVAVVMAYCGCGYWSLVFLFIVKSAIEALILSVFSGLWVPHFDFAYMRALTKFGSQITVHNVAHYFSGVAEKIMISRFDGVAALGIYSRSYTLFNVYAQMFPTIVAQILNSVYGKDYKRSPKENADIFYWILKYIFIIGGSGMAVVGVWAEEITLLVWGNQWGEAAPMLRVLAFSAIAFSQIVFGRVIFVSFGAENTLYKFSFGLLALIVGMCFAGSFTGGLYGIVVGYSIAFWAGTVVMGIILSTSIFKNTSGKYFSTLFKGIFASAVSGVVVAVLKAAGFGGGIIWEVVWIAVSFAAVVPICFAYVFFFERSDILKAKVEFKKLLGK